jgi:hypothetical protein
MRSPPVFINRELEPAKSRIDHAGIYNKQVGEKNEYNTNRKN